MKQSKRYLRGTFYGLAGLLVLLVAVSRLFVTVVEDSGPPRTPVSELAALRGFDKVNVQGGFDLRVVAADNFSVSYQPVSEEHGQFRATVEGTTLQLYGYGNRYEGSASQVVINLPVLVELRSNGRQTIDISGFTQGPLSIHISDLQQLILRNLQVATTLSTVGEGEVQMDAQSFAHVSVQAIGRVRVTSLPP
jgi:hypothetical protein